MQGPHALARTIPPISSKTSSIPSRSTVNLIKQAIKTLCLEGLSIPTAVERIKDEIEQRPEIEEILTFVSKAERGLAV